MTHRDPDDIPMKDSHEALEENNAWDRLSKWETYVDEKIRELIGDGNMSWHPGAGAPLRLDTDESVPEEMRLANKIMKDHDAVPAWMSLGHTLRDKYEKIMRKLGQFARDYVKRKADAVHKGSFILDRHAEDRWHEALRRLHEDVTRYNQELMNYNLQVPPGIDQRVPLNLEDEIQHALSIAQGKK